MFEVALNRSGVGILDALHGLLDRIAFADNTG